LIVVAVVGGPARAQSDAKVPDPDPELERKTFVLPEGFEVNLFAADPLLAKPIQMNFGPDGRLWVATSETYPQIKPGEPNRDKIVVLEDSKGVGKADKVSVFADGLLIPTGVAPGDGGCYVADSTDIVHFSDPDKTGKATRRRIVLSGFGTEDTHHIIHTFRWGPDGNLWFSQSVYIHSHVETPYGVRRLNGGGVWQYRPENQRLEVFMRGLWNTWGTDWDRYGQVFLTDGAGGEGINYGMPGAYYAASPGAPKVLPGLNPGHPKYCGLEIVDGRHLPEAWQGSLITHDFRGHRVCRFVVKPEGSGYAAIQQPDLIRSSHPAFRPVDVKMGPDGAIYIADWYNPIIQHGEVDFRDPRRDVTHGRIWRITAKGRPLVPRPKLVDAKTEDLLKELTAPETWTRFQARRVLQERGAEKVKPALAAWAATLKDEQHRLEALWMYQSLDVVEAKLLHELLRAHDGRVRAAAVRVLSAWRDRLDDPLGLLAERVTDDEPQVRLEAVRALGQIAQPRAASLALSALARPFDKFLDYGLYLTMRELQPVWMPALQQGKFDYGGDARRLLFALQAVGSPGVAGPLVDLVRQNKVPADGMEGVLSLIGTLGGPGDLGLLLDRATANEAPDRVKAAALVALEHAARQRNVRPGGDLGRVGPLLKSGSEPVRAAAARLAGAWRLEGLRGQLSDIARADKGSDALREAALDGLVSLGGAASRDAVAALVGDEKQPPSTRRLALIALVNLDPAAAAQHAAGIIALAPDGTGADAVLEAFLQHKGADAELTKALDDQKLPPDAARVALRTARAAGRDVTPLVEALNKAGGVAATRKLSPKERDDYVADVPKLGDPARGEAVFRRKDMVCLKCHAIGGAGGQVGPDLSGVGASAQVDYLLDSILEPNKAVKENYHAVLITTKRGKVYTGIKVRQTNDEVVLRTAEDKEVSIRRDNVEGEKPAPSLMPDGLADPLTRGELLDLTRFLAELGKGPYLVSPNRVVRRWQTLQPTPPTWTALYTQGYAAAVTGPEATWQPLYARVSGDVPLEELTRLEMKKPGTEEKFPIAFVRCEIDVTAAGPVRLRVNGAEGLSLWAGGEPAALKATTDLTLPVGTHTLTFLVDLAARKSPLRLEVEDVPGSSGRAGPLGGK
jgi:putative heme-binding domain-containing protein